MAAVNTGTPDTSVQSGVKEFVFAKLQTQQTTNIATNDHIKLDTVIAQRVPSGSIALDITTAFSNVAGAASIGRFTLKAGRTYRLRASVPYILASGATGLLDLAFYDATASAEIPGARSTLQVTTIATHDNGGGSGAEAVFTPTVDSLVELRIITATAITQIGTTGARTPTVFIESDI